MSLRADLADLFSGRVAIVGIGNPSRGDDAFGSLLAGRLAGRVGALVVDAEDVPESYLYAVIAGRPDTVLFLDAMDLAAAPGAAALLDAADVSVYPASTHRVPLPLLMEVVRRETGARTAVLAAQPGHTELGRPPSSEIAASVECLADLLAGLLPPAVRAAGGGGASGRVATC